MTSPTTTGSTRPLAPRPIIEALRLALRERGMGQILDVVPNHMGIAGSRNAWWSDSWRTAPPRPTAAISTSTGSPPSRACTSKVLLPILGDQYGSALENQELTLEFQGGGFAIRYFDTVLPLAPETYTQSSTSGGRSWRRAWDRTTPTLELQSIVTALSHLPGGGPPDPERRALRARERVVIKRRLASSGRRSARHPRASRGERSPLQRRKGATGELRSSRRLLGAQAYRLAFWQVAADEINYRRFFDINTLAAIRMEDPDVFEARIA